MWDSSLSAWHGHLSSYAAALELRETREKKSGLVALDRYVWDELPQQLSRRDSPHITATEYAKLVRWKLKRGKWRPRLQNFADNAANQEVVRASQLAFDALKKRAFKDALAKLVALKGCGPATASAILAAADHTVPFMSDELLLEAQKGKKNYTVPAYLALIRTVQAKADQLSKADGSHVWTARDIERAVFASRHYTLPALGSTIPPISSVPNGEASTEDAITQRQISRSRKRSRTAVHHVEKESETPATNVDDVDVKSSGGNEETIARPLRRKVTGQAAEPASDAQPLRRSARTKARVGG